MNTPTKTFKFSRMVSPITFVLNLPLWSVQKADRPWRTAMGYHTPTEAVTAMGPIDQTITFPGANLVPDT